MVEEKNRIEAYAFITLCIIGIILHLLTIEIPLYDDAGGIPIVGRYYDALFTNIGIYPHGVTNTLVFMLGMKFFGISAVGIRFTLFLVNMGYIIILFLFVKRVFGRKAACYAILLSLFTFFSYFNYFIIETDGIIQSFFSLLVFYGLYLFLYPEKAGAIRAQYYLLLSILSYAFLVSMKYRTGLLIVAIFFSLWYFTKQLKKAVIYSCIYVFSAVIISFLFFAPYYPIYGGDIAYSLYSIIFSHNTTQVDILYKITHPQLFVTLFVALSPIFLLLPFLTLQKWRNIYFLFYSWIFVCFLYILLIPPGLSFVKYVAGFLLPPLTILSAAILAEMEWKKFIPMTLILTVCLSIFSIYYNNTFPQDYWFFLTEMGPVVKVWQPFVYLTFGASFVLFLLFLVNTYCFPEYITLKYFVFSLFISIALSFNILMLSDNIVDQTHTKLIQQIKIYGEQHKNDLGIIYSWNEDVPVYLGNPGFYIVSEEEKDFGFEFDKTRELREYSRMTGMGQQGYIDLSLPLDVIKEYITKEGGTVFLLNYPYKYTISSNPDLQQKAQFIEGQCIKMQETTYKTATLNIYKCTATI
jgi:4-amino-4-deoxy-L-arabinose transferase-like glycosyltransferase